MEHLDPKMYQLLNHRLLAFSYPTSSNGPLRDHEPSLVGTVDVADGIPHLQACLDEGDHQRRAPGGLLYGQGASLAVIGGLGQVRVAIVLRFYKVLQDVVVVPTRIA